MLRKSISVRGACVGARSIGADGLDGLDGVALGFTVVGKVGEVPLVGGRISAWTTGEYESANTDTILHTTHPSDIFFFIFVTD